VKKVGSSWLNREEVRFHGGKKEGGLFWKGTPGPKIGKEGCKERGTFSDQTKGKSFGG